MCRELTPLKRAEARLRVQDRRLNEAAHREATLREEVDDLQQRVGRLIAQQRGPQCLDELIHSTDRPGQGS